MNIEIKKRFSEEIIISGKYDNIKNALELNRGVDLEGANLEGANLRGAKNIKLPIISIIGTKHSFYYCSGVIYIGCEKHSCQHWIDNYKEIGKMNEYSEKQIEEYYQYIKMCEKIL